MRKMMHWMLSAAIRPLVLTMVFCGASVFMACSSNDDNPAGQTDVSAISDKVWAYSQTHPDGFTLDIRTMTEPTEGIAVSYAATENSHSRDQLDMVVSHALQHEGYVGGWLNGENGLYYFDSTKLFPEDDLKGALQFGKENGQYSVFIGIDVAGEIAKRLGVGIQFVPTSWPTLTADVQAKPQTFDLAIGGITITDARRETMLMSDGYLANGKTILCRAAEADRYKSLADIDKSEVRVMVNPGGLNEKFANENLTHATVIVHPKNEEIPSLIAEGEADVMITEITEAPWYVQNDVRLAAPLLAAPFTHGEIGVLMSKGQDDLLALVNGVIAQMKADGTLRRLHEKYGLIYAYE